MHKLMGVLILLFTSFSSFSESHFKVLFDLSSDSRENWNTLLNNVENVRAELGPKTELRVVLHGGGIHLVEKKTAFQVDRINQLISDGVQFVGCENTMRRKKIQKLELLPNIGTVPAGLAELIRKQSQGWSYLKIGH
jgi:intracellular sulfur oxidation DsrE/DsrF family protein